MKRALLVAAMLIVPTAAVAQSAPAARDQPNFHARLYERYCDKLRESPQAYVQFVKRMQPVHGYTFTDFAPDRYGDPVKADCRVAAERMAARQRELKRDSR